MGFKIKGATHLGGTRACTTTSIAWLFGPVVDPGVNILRGQLDIWVTSWAKMDATDRKETRRTWALAVGKILKGKSPKITKGPVEATIAALLHLGWQPSAPDHWVISKRLGSSWTERRTHGFRLPRKRSRTHRRLYGRTRRSTHTDKALSRAFPALMQRVVQPLT